MYFAIFVVRVAESFSLQKTRLEVRFFEGEIGIQIFHSARLARIEITQVKFTVLDTD